MKRFDIKLTEIDYKKIELTAKKLNMTKAQVIRNSLNYGLAALLKFETGTKEAWKEIKEEIWKKPSGTVYQAEPEGDFIDEKDYTQEELIKIANTKWLTDEN